MRQRAADDDASRNTLRLTRLRRQALNTELQQWPKNVLTKVGTWLNLVLTKSETCPNVVLTLSYGCKYPSPKVVLT